MRKADLCLILRRRNLACDDHAVEGGSEASAAATWSGHVSPLALKRAHVHDYNEAGVSDKRYISLQEYNDDI